MISLLIVSAQLVGEADIVVFDAFKHHVETSRADHPFQPVVAIFALEQPTFYSARDLSHRLQRSCGSLRGLLHRWTRICALKPLAERGMLVRSDAVAPRPAPVGNYREIGPAKSGTDEPFLGSELAREPLVYSARLGRRMRFDRAGTLALGALEPAQFTQAPIDRLEMRVHHFLDCPRPVARGTIARQKGGLRPFVFDIFENDRRIENGHIAIDQRRNLAPRIGLQELLVRPTASDRNGHSRFVSDSLLVERDLDLLCIRRKRMLIDNETHFLSFLGEDFVEGARPGPLEPVSGSHIAAEQLQQFKFLKWRRCLLGCSPRDSCDSPRHPT